MMRTLNRLMVALCLALGASSGLTQSIERRPVDANYAHLASDNQRITGECAALLTSAPRESCSVALVQSMRGSTSVPDARIEAAFLSPSGNSPVLAAKDYVVQQLPESKLRDTDNSQVYTGDMLRSIVQRRSLRTDATIVVARGSDIDTSLLVENAGPEQFVIEQHSSPDQFRRNMEWLRARKHSSKVSVFDFTPRTRATVTAMGIDRDISKWHSFSQKIGSTFTQLNQTSALEPRTRAALLHRLMDPEGAVVVLYAHSDGQHLLLDTDDGVVQLSPADIREFGAQAGGKLPPVFLLNCEARAQLAPAFLEAGSPFVVATDKPLQLDEVAKFLKRFARSVFIDGSDVIDAYYVAQKDTKPYRLHPLAGNTSVQSVRPAAS